MENKENKTQVETEKRSFIEQESTGSGTLFITGVLCLIFISGEKSGLAAAGAFIGAGLYALSGAIQALAARKHEEGNSSNQNKDTE